MGRAGLGVSPLCPPRAPAAPEVLAGCWGLDEEKPVSPEFCCCCPGLCRGPPSPPPSQSAPGKEPCTVQGLLLCLLHGNLRTIDGDFIVPWQPQGTQQCEHLSVPSLILLSEGRAPSLSPDPSGAPQSTSSLITPRAPWKVPDSRQGCVVLRAWVTGPFHAAAQGPGLPARPWGPWSS